MNYRLDVSPTAQDEIKHLPGHVRQRVRRAIKDFAAPPKWYEQVAQCLITGDPEYSPRRAE